MALYFLDCEFNSFGGELLAMAIVRDDDTALSVVLPHKVEDLHPWVQQNVAPHFMADPYAQMIDPKDLPRMIRAFIGLDHQPVIVADWPDDISYFCKALMVGPGMMVSLDDLTFRMVKVQSYPTTVPGAIQHNAYWDAMALKAALLP